MKYHEEIDKLDQAAAKALFLAQGLNPESEHLTLNHEAVYGFQEVLRGIRADIQEARQGLAREFEKS
jgi:hypothetical protein